MRLSPGQNVGPYEILMPLGAGGMGEVYKARDTRLERTVAIKAMPADKCGDPDRRRRFLQEARAASALNHPHIVTIYDLLHDDGLDYIVMEYVAGRTLDEAIPNGGMRAEQALRIAGQIADALARAHAAAIVHRDLKPSNVMLTEDGQVKVLDFGLAKLLHAEGELNVTVTAMGGETIAGMVVGTAAYMSPEQAEGRPVDARSDIFSFGALLYEMLTGHKAFRGDSPVSILAAVLRSDPEPLPSGTPPDLECILTRCLRKEPHRRYQQTIELKLALEEAASPTRSRLSGTSDRALPSLIVLPFSNLSAERDNDYFADGLTEEILSALSAVPGLRIIARTSTFAAREKELSLGQIAEQMKVTHALEGSVRRAGGRIRVTAKLFTTSDQTQLWSERFDREMRDIFEVQDEIAGAVVEALKGRFITPSDEKLVAKPTSNIEAYNLLLRARYDIFKLETSRVQRADEMLRQAIALDPRCGEAHALKASQIWTSVVMGLVPPRPALDEAAAAARKALEIDPQHPCATAFAGIVAGVLDWNWRDCDALIERAYRLAPEHADTCQLYASWHLRRKGRYAEGIAVYESMMLRDPLCANWRAFQAMLAYYSRDFAAANRLATLALEIDPSQLLAQWVMMAVLLLNGDAEGALAAGANAVRLSGGNDWVTSTLAVALAQTGRQDEAAAIRDRLREASRIRYVYPLALIDAAIACGDGEGALDEMERAADERSPSVFWLMDDPALDPLRRHPRFSAVLARIGLPERY